MQKINSLILSLLVVLSSVQLASSQVDTTNTISDTLFVTKALKLSTKNHEAFVLSNTYTKTSTQQLTPKYIYNKYPIEITKPSISIRPITYKNEVVKKGNDGLIKIGYGTPQALDAKLLYSYHIEDWYAIGAKLGYSAARQDSIQNMEYNTWHTGIFGSYWLKPNIKAVFDTDYYRKQQGFYSQASAEPLLPFADRVCNHFDATLGLHATAYETSGWQSSIVARLANTGLSQDTLNEINTKIQGHLARRLSPVLTLDLSANHASAKYGKDTSTNYLSLTPRLRYQAEQWIASAGVAYTQTSDQSYIWPALSAKYTFTGIPLSLGLDSKSESTLIGLEHLHDINPFIATGGFLPLGTKVENSIGINGQYTVQKQVLELGVSTTSTTNAVIYTYTNGLYIASLSPRLQDTKLSAGASGSLLDWFSYSADINYSIYDDVGQSVGYLPIVDASLKLTESLFKSKLRLSQGLQVLTRNERTGISQPIDAVATIADLSAEIEYRLFPQFSIYAEGSNLLNQNYQIWDHYPVFSPRIVGGFKYIIK